MVAAIQEPTKDNKYSEHQQRSTNELACPVAGKRTVGTQRKLSTSNNSSIDIFTIQYVHTSTQTVVSHQKRDHHVIRGLETELTIYIISRRQFRTIFK